MRRISLKILFLIIFLIRDTRCEISSAEAMQMASKLRSCVPVNPAENLGDYLNAFLGSWHVIKLYDAPMRQDHPIPQVVITKNPNFNQYYMEMDWQPRKKLFLKFNEYINTKNFSYWIFKSSINGRRIWKIGHESQYVGSQ